MCTTCLQAISQFRHTPTPSPWALNRAQVADRLLELVEHPDSLSQGAIGLCGPAAFLRAWLRNDHLAVVRFAIELYNTGHSHVGAWRVAAAPQLMGCDHAAIVWPHDLRCPCAEWMMMGAIQDEQNTFRPDFNGQPVNDWSLGTLPRDVIGMLQATGRFGAIENRTSDVAQNIFDDNGCDDALLLTPDDRTDVVLYIHAGLIDAGSQAQGDLAFWDNNVANHFIGLIKPLQKLKHNGADAVRMSYFSWGAVHTDEVFPCADFDSKYYGAVVAHAQLPREPLPCTTPDTPAVPVQLAACIEGAGVRLSWCGGSVNDERYDIQRWRASVGGWDTGLGIDAARPSTAPVGWHDGVVTAAGSDTVWYRVRAVNRLGCSNWTAPVMLRLPIGDSRSVDPQRDPDVRRPPCFVDRVSVLRAPAGLQADGYGSFTTPPAAECQAAQWVYDAHWEVDAVNVQRRKLVLVHNAALRADREAYVFVHFNDHDGTGQAHMQDQTVQLRLSGNTPGGGVVDIELPLQPGPGHRYYWGRFDPIGCSAGYFLRIEIEGRDAAERYVQRQPDGHQIDANPRTRARPRLDLPPVFPFVDYEPGVDRNHGVQIAARATRVDADTCEPNNSHAQARPLLLLADAPGSGNASLNLPVLSFGTDSDVDHFLVSYPASAADDACALMAPETVTLSANLGLSIRRYPPSLTVTVTTDDPLCIDMALYAAAGTPCTHDLPQTRQLTVWNPTRAHFADHRFELVLKNSAPALQGPFAYRLHLQYRPALNDWGLDTGAPAYRPRTTLARQLLQRLYARIDLPRPGENVATRWRRDSKLLVQRTAALLLDPQTYADLKTLLPAHSVAEITEDFRRVAAVARTFGLLAEAESLLRAASSKAGLARHRPHQVAALQDLQALYTAAGRLREAATVAARLRALTAPH